jgi:competence/damage-inducible protein CinA-like protein
MKAEIIAIGSELTTGAKLDTNSQWLSIELASIGIPVHFHQTVADELDVLAEIIRIASERSDLILITGGLGPTLDDLTREAIAQFMNAELELHEPSLDFIKKLFARFNRTMPERNKIQAMFPKGSKPLNNPRGTAPGIWVDWNEGGRNVILAAMPGVPSEMKRMFRKELLPGLPAGNNVIKIHRVNCFGLGESPAEEMLGELTARGREPEVGITVHQATITLRIAASGKSEEECETAIQETKRTINEILDSYVFGEEDEELQDIVVSLLNEKELTLSTAEFGTGGLVSHLITEVENYDQCFSGGLVIPKLNSRIPFLEDLPIEKELAPEKDLESDGQQRVAEMVARSCKEHFQSNFSIAIIEVPAPSGEKVEGKPDAYICLVGPDISISKKHYYVGDPAIRKIRAAKTALNLLRLHLLGFLSSEKQ